MPALRSERRGLFFHQLFHQSQADGADLLERFGLNELGTILSSLKVRVVRAMIVFSINGPMIGDSISA